MGMSFQVVANDSVVLDAMSVSNTNGFMFLRMMGINNEEYCGIVSGRDFLKCASGLGSRQCAPVTTNATLSIMQLIAYGEKFAAIENTIAHYLALDARSDVHISYG